MSGKDALVKKLLAHTLQGDTARVYDEAGQCTCGRKFYEVGETPSGYLEAHQRLLLRHAEHVADTLLEDL